QTDAIDGDAGAERRIGGDHGFFDAQEPTGPIGLQLADDAHGFDQAGEHGTTSEMSALQTVFQRIGGRLFEQMLDDHIPQRNTNGINPEYERQRQLAHQRDQEQGQEAQDDVRNVPPAAKN